MEIQLLLNFLLLFKIELSIASQLIDLYDKNISWFKSHVELKITFVVSHQNFRQLHAITISCL